MKTNFKINWDKIVTDPTFIGYENDGFVLGIITYAFKENE